MPLPKESMDSSSRKRRAESEEGNEEHSGLPVRAQTESTSAVSGSSSMDLPSQPLGKLVSIFLSDVAHAAPVENFPGNSHAQVTDENTPSGSSTAPLAEFLRDYYDVIKRQNRSLEETVFEVLAGVKAVYSDQLEEDAKFIRSPIVCTLEKPCSPFKDITEAAPAFLKGITDIETRRRTFSACIPGLSLFSAVDRESLLSSQPIEMQAIHRGPILRGKTPDDYFHNGKDAGCHPCLYWMRQVNELKTIDRAFMLAFLINELELNSAERYVAMCIIMFRPVGVPVENRKLMHFFYIHYTDIFRHLIARRPGRPLDFHAWFRRTVERFSNTAADGDLLRDAAAVLAASERSATKSV